MDVPRGYLACCLVGHENLGSGWPSPEMKLPQLKRYTGASGVGGQGSQGSVGPSAPGPGAMTTCSNGAGPYHTVLLGTQVLVGSGPASRDVMVPILGSRPAPAICQTLADRITFIVSLQVAPEHSTFWTAIHNPTFAPAEFESHQFRLQVWSHQDLPFSSEREGCNGGFGRGGNASSANARRSS